MSQPTGRSPSDPLWSTGAADAETQAFPVAGSQDPTRPYLSQPAPPSSANVPPAYPPGANLPPPGYPPSYPPAYPPPSYPPTYPPAWGSPPPGDSRPTAPPPPPRRRGPSATIVVLALLLGIATVTGAAAWYLLLFQPAASAKPTPTSNLAFASPTAKATRQITPQPTPTGTPRATAGPTPAPSVTKAPTPAATPPASPSGEPSPSAIAASPSSPTGSEAPASIDPSVVAQIDAVISEVPDLRGLQPTKPVPYRFITRDQFATEFQQQFAKDNPPDQLAAEESLDKHLGLLPASADLAALATQLYTSQVLAFYDPGTKDFTVIAQPGGQFTAADRVTVAHEYDHALQDQHWDLVKLQKVDPSEGDRANAITALAEGDATNLMYQWALQYLTPEEIASLGTSGSPDDQALLDSMPLLLRRSLEFPYDSGLQFVVSLRAAGGWDGVNAAWDNPPVSTEQIIHPEKYTSGEQPIEITLPDVAAKLGSGWTAQATETEGEFDTSIWLADGVEGPPGLFGPGPLPNADAAAGWGGDRLVSLAGPNGTWAVAWQTAWDTPTDATEFSTAATMVMADLPGAHTVAAASIAGDLASPVLVLVASDAATLSQLQTSLGVGG